MPLQVGPSEIWQGSRAPVPIPKHFDWTYTSAYCGTLAPGVRVEPTDECIDLERLKRPDPLLFVDTVPLYEDELDDNGTTEVGLRTVSTGFIGLGSLNLFDLQIFSILLSMLTTKGCLKFSNIITGYRLTSLQT